MTLHVNGRPVKRHHEGYLIDPSDWNENLARAVADMAQVPMADDLRALVNLVRDYCGERQGSPEHRVLLSELRNRHGKEKATRRHICRMLPEGDGQQACELAGRRVPLKLLLDL